MNKNYSELSGQRVVKTDELTNLKAGFTSCNNYGCDSNVCNTNRAGAKDLCSTAYCISGVGPVKLEENNSFIING